MKAVDLRPVQPSRTKVEPTSEAVQDLPQSVTLGPQLFVPRQVSIDENLKPQAQLWTSTARPVKGGYTSDWAEYLSLETDEQVSSHGTLYDVAPGAKILSINTDKQAAAVARRYGVKLQDRYQLLRSMPWDKIAQDYDAIHHQPQSRAGNLLMNTWDVESTAWFNTQHLINPRKVSVVVDSSDQLKEAWTDEDQRMVHKNPSVQDLKRLSRNARYHSARFVIYKDGSLVAADSEHYTHHSMAPAMGAWEVRGYVTYMGDNDWAYRSMEVYSPQNKDHPLLRKWEASGIDNGNPSVVEESNNMPVLYHGIIVDNLPSIHSNGLAPRVGSFTGDIYGNKAKPLVFAADADQARAVYCSLAVSIYKKIGHMPDLQEFLDNAAVLVIEKDRNKFKKYEGKIRKGSMEPGDYYSAVSVVPDRVLQGENLNNWLKQTGADRGELCELAEAWSKKYKKSIDCNNPKGFSQRAHCAGRRKRQVGGKTSSQPVNEAFNQPYDLPSRWAGDPATKQITLPDGQRLKIEIGWDPENRFALVNFFVDDTQKITHKGDAFKIFSTVIHAIADFVRKRKPTIIAWTASDNEPSRVKFYDRLVPWMQKNNILSDYLDLTDSEHDLIPDDFLMFVDEYQEPSGRVYVLAHKRFLSQQGAHELDEDLRKWFREKWVRFGPDGKIRGACARGSEGEGKPKCLPQRKAWALGKKKRATAARRKRREDPNPERAGKARNVATKESVTGVKLGDLCTIKTNFPDADFWLVRRTDRKNVGKPVREFSPYHVGIKVTDTDKLDSRYLYYVMTHLFNRGYWAEHSYGMSNLVHIRTDDVKNIALALQEDSIKQNQALQETWQHTVDINQLAAICAKWIESQKPQGQTKTQEVAQLAKKAGIFSNLTKDTQKYILDDHFDRNPLTITVDFASPEGAMYGYYSQGNHNIRIFYKSAKSFGLAEAIAHELQHAIDEIRVAWSAYQGNPVKVTDMASLRKYLKDPSEVNARLASVLFQLSQMNITTQQLPKALATLLDQHHLSPRGEYALSNTKYKKLLSRSYKFYANSKTLQQQQPAKTMWEKIKYYAARVAEAVLGPDINESFDREEFLRHMAKLRAREELRKTDPVKALVQDLKDQDKQQPAKKSSDDSDLGDPDIDPLAESLKQCPHCGGPVVSEQQLEEKKDACYYKVKSRYKVWPSAYASGALVQCRKRGAANWGKSKTAESNSLLEAKKPLQVLDIRYTEPTDPTLILKHWGSHPKEYLDPQKGFFWHYYQGQFIIHSERNDIYSWKMAELLRAQQAGQQVRPVEKWLSTPAGKTRAPFELWNKLNGRVDFGTRTVTIFKEDADSRERQRAISDVKELQSALKILMRYGVEQDFKVKGTPAYIGNTVGKILAQPDPTTQVLSREASVMYHGTSSSRWQEIQKTGLVPGRTGDAYVDLIPGYSSQNVYLGTNPKVAEFYAKRQARKDGDSEGVILQVSVPDPSLLLADDEYMPRGTWSDKEQRVIPPSPEEIARLGREKWRVARGGRDLGSFAYRGRIPPGMIKLARKVKMPASESQDLLESTKWFGQGDEPLPTKLYHVTRTRNRLSIRQRGLVPKTKEHKRVWRKPGVFGFETFEQAQDWAHYWSQDEKESMDIWEISVDPSALVPDPAWDIQKYYDAWVLYNPVPPQDLTLKSTQRWTDTPIWTGPSRDIKKLRNLEEDPDETQ